MAETEQTIQDVVDTGMSAERIRDVVNGIAKGVRYRLDPSRPRGKEEARDIRVSLARIADALEYLVALSKRQQSLGPNA